MSGSRGPMKFSLALGAKKTTAPTPAKRPHSSLQDSDDEDASSTQPQAVSHFDIAAGGAIDINNVEKKKGPLVIEKQADRYSLPQAAQRDDAANADTDVVNGDSAKYGLIIAQSKDDAQDGNDGGDTLANGDIPAADAEPATAPEPMTDDEKALAALLGDNPKSSFVLPAVSEEEAFQRDFRDAPNMATLEEYAAMPVEEFGAALLRGMGWKDGDPIGKRRDQAMGKPKEVVRRSALLGIGAKEDAAVTGEIGTWGKGMKGSRRKVDQSYNPVLLQNKRTGERMTEEELKVKEEQDKMVEAAEKKKALERGSDRERSHRDGDRRERRDRYDDRDYRDRKDRDRDRDRDRERYKDRRRDDRDQYRESDRSKKSSHRDRSSSEESYRRRRRDDDDDRKRDRRDRDKECSRRDRDDYNKEYSRRDRWDRGDTRERDRRRRD